MVAVDAASEEVYSFSLEKRALELKHDSRPWEVSGSCSVVAPLHQLSRWLWREQAASGILDRRHHDHVEESVADEDWGGVHETGKRGDLFWDCVGLFGQERRTVESSDHLDDKARDGLKSSVQIVAVLEVLRKR